MLEQPGRFTSAVDEIVLRDLRTSPIVLASIKVIECISRLSGIPSDFIWFLLNCAIDIGIAIALHHTAQQLRERTTGTLKYLSSNVWVAKKSSEDDSGTSAGEDKAQAVTQRTDESKFPKGLVPCLPMAAAFYLFHPLSIYRCVAKPSLEAFPLLCLASLLSVSLEGPTANVWAIALLLTLYCAVNFSTAVLSLLFPIGAALAGTTQGFARLGEALSSRELMDITFHRVALLLLSVAGFTLLTQMSALWVLGFHNAKAATIELWRRHLSFEFAQRPDAGALWYLVLVMFKGARSVFFLFFNYHLVVHSFPLTLRFCRYNHFLLLFLTATVPLFERQVTLPCIVFSLALLLLISPIVGNVRILWMAALIQAVPFGLQFFVLDLWVKNDAANINLTYLAAVVPYIMLSKSISLSVYALPVCAASVCVFSGVSIGVLQTFFGFTR